MLNSTECEQFILVQQGESVNTCRTSGVMWAGRGGILDKWSIPKATLWWAHVCHCPSRPQPGPQLAWPLPQPPGLCLSSPLGAPAHLWPPGSHEWPLEKEGLQDEKSVAIKVRSLTPPLPLWVDPLSLRALSQDRPFPGQAGEARRMGRRGMEGTILC